ncbi:phosphotransferase family protein [Glycomyces terrestris]|uniref:Aminoglycoside phosphotransferase family protein n=1 Tax=Glycomyces terrestris TaxID=2493553 RepID=A0A426V5C8_9ACTN|nr:phosphotransferase [Glycomyces terrestris]RRS02109.1 aminoglycoside phosphotransferase family protein [Glycomyces terrestris]
MTRFGTPPPLDATAVRPDYADLPDPVRRLIARELGGEPDAVRIAGGGYTRGFAARLRSGSGPERFVKAAGPETPLVRDMYRQEARIAAALPPELPAPRLLFADEAAGWSVAGFEAVQGNPVTLPIRPTTVTTLLTTWAEAAEALDPPPEALVAAGIRSQPPGGMKEFTAVAAGEEPPFALPPRLHGRIDELAALEAPIDAVLRTDRVSHADLRVDNFVCGADRAWICDWAEPAYLPPWIDTVVLLLAAHADGHDADALFWGHPTAAGVSGEELDTALTAVTGGLLRGWDERPENLISAAIDDLMRWSGLAAADWLADRRHW